MALFGLIGSRQKAAPPTLSQVGDNRGGIFGVIRDHFPGAWQQNVEVRLESVLAYNAVYACVSLIASDIGKLRVKLVSVDDDGIWTETTSPAFSPVLRKPNRYQTRIKFFEQWVTSKLVHGNAYIFKQRDNRNVITSLYVLDPTRTKPLVAPDGSVFYQLCRDNLSGVQEDDLIVPASEVIHDTMAALYHPLVGVSPIYACGLAAAQGLRIQNASAKFFETGGRPYGILTAPGRIDPATAERIQKMWQENTGRTAVVGDGLTYEQLSVNAVDSQLIEQLKWSAETVCSAFHVPPYMIGVGPTPLNNNVEALQLQYYTQCVQSLIENIEVCLDEGLELPSPYGTEFDIDGLLRMDTATQYKTLGEGIGGALLTPNEGRRKIDLKPLAGGNTAYMQQQNYSLAALDKRDRQDDPFAAAAGRQGPTAAPAINDNVALEAAKAISVIQKEFA